MSITLNSATRSNRDWKTQFQFTDGDPDSPTYGQLLDFTGAFIAIAVVDQECCQRILATTDNGLISIISTGVIELDVPYSQMNLCAGSYRMGGYYQLNGDTVDLFEGDLTIQQGIPKP
ncbi:hypothetical protein [Bradyrhizobium elkanii]|uniref:hypothetical protein n=1 Tax=Bradyrhizobium elkanii TaxID=29448 RepID=UPI0021691D16|nr:hypothetical protein [Bradyrhizobium elkanii]MCS3692005.1 hypothetical protein [Bradyrhizobium elkanii]